MGQVGLILADRITSKNEPYKLTLEIAGKTIIERCVESMIESVSRIVVVCGYKEEVIRKIVTRYYHVDTVFNPHYDLGMLESVKCGLKNITSSQVFIMPGDYPLVKKKTFKKLLSRKGDIIVPSFKGEKGYPILINQSIIQDIIFDSEASCMRDILDKQQTLIDVNDAGILVDVDTIEDYYHIYRQFNQ